MVKDLALVNPFAETTIKSLLLFYKHPIISIDEHHTLDIVFNHFREGKSHMAFVREHKKKDIIGIVTLEDILEEVLQVEINDETDIVLDNREMRPRTDAQIPNDLETIHAHINDAMTRRRAKDRILANISPQLPRLGNHHLENSIRQKLETKNRIPKILPRGVKN